jgi:glycosyltransferase involved in cell wall biosynthesis
MRVLLIAPAAPPYGGMALQAQQLERLLCRDGVDVVFLASNFPLPSLLRPLERVGGVRTIVRALLIWLQLWSRVRRVDVVHVFAASWLYFFLTVYPAVITGRLCGKRVVINYRGGQANEFFSRFGPLTRPAFRLATVVTAPSQFLAEVIQRHLQVEVSIVPNILDLTSFRYRRRSTMRPELLVTRHLDTIYDIESVLRAFGVVQKEYPEASLWIAGTGPEEGRLRGLVSAWNLAHVTFLGEVTHANLPAVCDQRDIYVNASRVDNFPGALLEASAAGLVLVTTNAGGIPFIYQDTRTAFLVEVGDWQSLGAAIIRVLRNPSAALELTTAALAVARGCDWGEVRQLLYAVYGISPVECSTQTLKGAGCAAG